MHQLHADRMLLPDGWAHGVRLDVDGDGFIARVEMDVDADGAERLGGPVLPGMVDAHSHAFQRLIAGLTDTAERPDDSFWSWREAMYRAVARLDPDQLEAACRHVYVEMLRAGYTSVAEFHYVHHQPDGIPYTHRAELADRVLAAAADSGIGLALLPVLYAHGGLGGRPRAAGQRRFVNDVDGFLALHEQVAEAARGQRNTTTGVALHSLRAVTGDEIATALAALPGDAPVHIHVAEQRREVDDCLAWSGQRPVEWLLDHADVDDRWCLVHGTHVTTAELDALAARGPVVGLCPTTEANLGDGLFPAEAWLARDGALAIGSDSHVSLSVAEELRWLEYGQRLRAEQRNRLATAAHPAVGEQLYARAAAGGARASGQPVGRIAAGRRADLVVLDDDDPLLAACPDAHLLNRWIFGAGDRAVREVRVAGERVVADGHHALADHAAQAFARVCRDVLYA